MAAIVALACAVPASHAQVSWTTIVNNGDLVPGTTAHFNSYNQPAINSAGLVVFRARGRVLTGGETPVPTLWSLAMEEAGMVQQGVFMRDMVSGGPITVLAKRGTTVPSPNNTAYNGVLSSFIEFPSSPRIDALSSIVATRGQHEPAYTYLDVDGVSEIRVGTAGVYANPGSGLVTGAGLYGAVSEVQPDRTYALSFPWFSVPDALPGTRFDQFPGSPTAFAGTKVGFKGNFTDPVDGIGKTGVYVRDVAADGGKSPVMHIAGTTVVIPNQPAGGTVKFGATAAPSGAGGYVAFTGWDVEEAPTLGGIYRAPVMNNPPLQALASVGQQVPGEAAGFTFTQFGEGLSMGEDGRFVAFWATWGIESTPKLLYCPADGNVDLLAYCNATYPSGFLVQIPVRQGIFVADAQTGQVLPIAKTGTDGIADMLYWVFSGAPPGVGGSEDDDREPPRWRSSAFAALAAKAGHLYGNTSPFQIAFKAKRNGVDGIYLRKGTLSTPLITMVEALVTPGSLIDTQAPAGSIVTTVGIERDGFRHENLAIAVGMLYETVETSIGWGGLYLAHISPPAPPTDTTPSITLGSTVNPSTVGQYVTYRAVVSGASGTPTGTIVFRDNGVIIDGCGGLVMASGRASCTIGNQALGTHSMTAVYSGDSFYKGITSSTLPQVVNAAKANTPSITVGSSVNPSTVGQYIELTAVVSGTAGTPTGTLVFLDNGDPISGCGGLPMTNGAATCTPGSLTLGTHAITVVYPGNVTYNGVTSSTLPQTVIAAKANTPSFTLGSSQNPSVSGNVVTFTAVLSGPAGTPTGNVVFRDNGQMISGCGGIALVNGSVTCSPRLDTVGTHSITGIYLGDANYNGITSSVLPQTVQ